ncbi:toprim domain-containing protein [Niallia sp. 03133]|uniref:toprim domain-containing protein n=1 Tax=Niallia sp. 03133 TaxID=3458060 RepID=UPI00404481A9
MIKLNSNSKLPLGDHMKKIIIVEGKSDKSKIKNIIREPIDIICTNGTIGISKLDELIEELFDKDVYILVDADKSGEKLRKQFKKELPEAEHLYIDRMYREVASAPEHHLAAVLLHANIDIFPEFLDLRMS